MKPICSSASPSTTAKTLADTLRTCLVQVINFIHKGEQHLRETDETRTRRELRKARRASNPEADALLKNFTLDEPADDASPQDSPSNGARSH
jgi:hypothetical protein